MFALYRAVTLFVLPTANLLADMPRVTWQQCKDTIADYYNDVWRIWKSARKGTNCWQRADIPKSIPLVFFQVIEDDMPKFFHISFFFEVCA